MLFNSHEFIFIFLPVVLIGYYLLCRRQGVTVTSRLWLVGASLFFYGWFKAIYLVLIAFSILFNFAVGRTMGLQESHRRRQWMLLLGLLVDVGLLGYFKYYDFFVSNMDYVFGLNWTLKHMMLPLAISFFTFGQIAYLVDCYRREAPVRYSLLNYSLYVLFFPHLLAGPIVLHHEMMPQFDKLECAKPNWLNLSKGFHLFSVGLFKKLVLADTFASWVPQGFDVLPELTFWQAWICVIAYTLQIYFDFSGYCDMAIGLARMFNIYFPANFNSPYRANNIKDFWLRWHMTLGRFMSHYVYFPLGGNRKGKLRTYFNLMATFLVSGLWHGAGWTFVAWGGFHGAGMTIQRAWSDMGLKMHLGLSRALTLVFVMVAWVFFRATSMENAVKVLKGMFCSSNFAWSTVSKILPPEYPRSDLLPWLLGGAAIVLLFKNAMERTKSFRPTVANGIVTIVLFTIAVLHISGFSKFIYYNF